MKYDASFKNTILVAAVEFSRPASCLGLHADAGIKSTIHRANKILAYCKAHCLNITSGSSLYVRRAYWGGGNAMRARTIVGRGTFASTVRV